MNLLYQFRKLFMILIQFQDYTQVHHMEGMVTEVLSEFLILIQYHIQFLFHTHIQSKLIVHIQFLTQFLFLLIDQSQSTDLFQCQFQLKNQYQFQ